MNKEEKKVEIIFNSADQDLKSFNEYFSTMPWIATPFDSESKSKIDDACGINSIPQLIIFDNKGNIIDDSGRRTVETQGDNAINVWKEKLEKVNEQKTVEISKSKIKNELNDQLYDSLSDEVLDKEPKIKEVDANKEKENKNIKDNIKETREEKEKRPESKSKATKRKKTCSKKFSHA